MGGANIKSGTALYWDSNGPDGSNIVDSTLPVPTAAMFKEEDKQAATIMLPLMLTALRRCIKEGRGVCRSKLFDCRYRDENTESLRSQRVISVAATEAAIALRGDGYQVSRYQIDDEEFQYQELVTVGYSEWLDITAFPNAVPRAANPL